ncbi:glycoside hydrolase family 16 protein [Paenisporosarcina cavernae]|uniref:glycoside hydrolase family 16 protein n=1 Tax=Paenisporosarcina cavernae TaxID=2320858 RepID=UPI0013C44275|nr:glycoside hydrolase family 16 protein [Paenisporosarcina cavernae]
MKHIVLLLLLLSGCSSAPAETHSDPIPIAKPTTFAVPGWNLVFQDEFDDPETSTLLWNKVHLGTTAHGRLHHYLPEQVSIENGMLHLQTDNIPYKEFAYRSGAVTTQNRFEPLYGKFVIRAKLPEGKGMFPAIWLLPANNEAFPEIDIVEMIGQKPEELWHVAHVNETTNDNFVTTDYIGADWNIYTLDWSKENLIFSLNGVETFRTANISHTPMYVWMNVAVGGVWAETPDASTPTSTEMVVDYVRIYERDT